MAIMSKTKINAFVDSILNNRDTFDAEKRVKAKKVLRSIPLDKEDSDKLIDIQDVDFSPIAKEKQEQRFEDVQTALEDAVEQGVETLDDFTSWLGMNEENDPNKIMDFAHAYVRLGKRKNPSSMSGFIS